jgi:integrase
MIIEKVYRKDLDDYRWKIDITVAGRRIRRADFERKKDAEDAIAALKGAHRNARYGLERPQPSITLGQLRDRAAKDRKIQKKKSDLRIFGKFVALIGEGTKLINLTKADLRKYTDTLVDQCSSGSINRYQIAISSILNAAPKLFGELDSWRPPQMEWATKNTGRTRVLTDEELGKLFAACLAPRQPGEKQSSVGNRHELFDLFRLILLTGGREGEILRLKDTSVDWRYRDVKLTSIKGPKGRDNPKTRWVPLSNLALEILESRKHHAPGFFKIGRGSLYSTLARIGEISGVEYGERIEGGWVTYDLRHNAATVMENSGVPRSAVEEILGHSKQGMTSVYAHALSESIHRGIAILEEYVKSIVMPMTGF